MERDAKKLYYKIGEACRELDIQPYVLRYWETEFAVLSPSKSRSGQRVYTERELGIIRRIKELLYQEGYTIAGAKKKLDAEMASGGPHEGPAPAKPSPPARESAAANGTAPPAPAAVGSKPPPGRRGKVQRALPLDTSGGERPETLRRGIEKALAEARELLALLDAHR